jgi:malonate decarboxylase epsilon subunit
MSVGAFAAAAAAGALNLGDGVRLVKQRAEGMVKLYPKGYGLAAIVGLTEKQVSTLVEAAYTERNPVYVANINAPRQIVIAGSDKGMNNVLEAARKSGARKAMRLNVSEPSHCPLLEPVADALRDSLQAIHLQPPKTVYVGNVTGRALRSAEAISEDLASNIAHGVRWYDATTVLDELGFRLFLEMPPGHVSTNLVAESIPGVRAISIADRGLRYGAVVAARENHGSELTAHLKLSPNGH